MRGRVGLPIGEGADGFDVQVGELQNGGHRKIPLKRRNGRRSARFDMRILRDSDGEGHETVRIHRELSAVARRESFGKFGHVHLEEFA